MASISFYIVCGVTAVLAYIIFKCATLVSKYKTFLSLSDKLVHVPFHWFWGVMHLLTCFKDLFDTHQQFVHAGHQVVLYWLGPIRPVVAVLHPDTVKAILKTATPKAKSGAGYCYLVPWLGDGLLISEGKKWERNRKLLTSAFHFEILQPYVSVYDSVTEVMMTKLEEECKNGEFTEVFQSVSLATLDTMLQCAFSYQDNIQKLGTHHPYVANVSKVSALLLKRTMNVFMLFTTIYKLTKNGREFYRLCDYMHKFADEIITKRKIELENEAASNIKNKRHLDFLDILITARDTNNQPLTDIEIRDEVDTFLFEGHDTTASAISWCLYSLAKYPKEQEKVYADVRKVLDVSTTLTWKDINEFKYLPLFIKETMRYFSPVPSISRQLDKPMVIDGVEIPKDVIIDINMVFIHHNPNIWPNPQEFLPERFENNNIVGKDPYSFVPFSAGPRNCIGQNFALNEIKTMVSKVVHRFHIEFDENRIPEPIPEIVTRAKHGLYLRFTPRENPITY